MQEKKSKVFIALVPALLISIIIWGVYLQPSIADYLTAKTPMISVLVLTFSSFASLVTFLIIYYFVSTYKKTKNPLLQFTMTRNFYWGSFIVYLLLSLIGLYLLFNNEVSLWGGVGIVENYLWHFIPFPLLAIVLLALFMTYCMFSGLLSSQEHFLCSKKTEKIIFWLLVIAAACIAGYMDYYPNVINDVNDIHHMDAYYNSIYNTFYGVPHTNEITSIYGHYSILFLPFLKIFTSLGISNLFGSFQITLFFINFSIVMMFCYAVYVFIPDNKIKFLAPFAGIFRYVMSLRYLQRVPHRIFPLLVIMFLIALYVRYPSKRNIISIIGFLICPLLIVWSTDIGMVAVFSWSSFHIFMQLQQKSLKNPKFWINAAVFVFLIFAAFLGAVGFVGLYNICIGNRLIGITEFTGAATNTNYVKALGADRPAPPSIISAWMFVVGMFLLFACVSIVFTRLFEKGQTIQPKIAGYFSIAVLGLGSLIYYMNRSAYSNIELALFPTLFFLTVLSQFCLPSISLLFAKKKKYNFFIPIESALGIVSIFVLFCFALGSLTHMGMSIEHWKQYRDTANQDILLADIKENVPENTPAIGYSTAEIYSLLEWDKQLYVMDTASYALAIESEEYLINAFRDLEHKPLFTNTISLNKFHARFPDIIDTFYETHVLVYEVEYLYDDTFQYYEPIQ